MATEWGRYVGIPFKHLGTDPEKGLDCFNLLKYIYKKELTKIDSTIAKVRNQKITIKEYYKEKGEEIDKMTKSEIDSLLHKRYNY
jgi:hypothetical protein